MHQRLAVFLLCAAAWLTPGVAAAQVTHTLTVNIVGNGETFDGTVDCLSSCSYSVDDGTVLSVTARPGPPSDFVSWSGCDLPDNGSGQCQVTMSSDRTVTATFTSATMYDIVLQGEQVVPYVITSGFGSAHVEYDATTHQIYYTVTLSGLQGSVDQVHVHEGALRGANAPILTSAPLDTLSDVVMLLPQEESELLAGELYIDVHTSAFPDGEIRGQIDNLGATALQALTVSRAGNGVGTVSGTTEAGTVVDCGANCANVVPQGKVVTLTATPGGGSIFSGWSGDCTGVSATCQVTMDAAKTVGAVFTAVAVDPRLSNISTRATVFTGSNVMIGGFIIGGSSAKTVAITATGPSLAAFGITNPLANPTLTIVRSSDQSIVATNDDWQADANASLLQASGFAPSDAREAGLYLSLAPGAYTAIVSGAGGATGVSVVGVFEVDRPDIPLVNISTRGLVQAGNNVMIGGFVVQGTVPQQLAITAAGPSLGAFGIANPLANPALTIVRSSDQAIVASNDDWQTDPNAAQLQAAGFAPSNPLEPGILTTLAPGAYTAIVSGTGGATGVAVVGVFDAP